MKREILKLTLEGLVPIAFMERAQRRCERPAFATAAEMMPSDMEREEIVETLCMADTLVAGGAMTKKQHRDRAKALTALAKAIAIGACVPGGIKVFDTHWYLADGRLMSESVDQQQP